MFEITYFGAIFAGLLSFLSPCILPIVPFYLSYLAGVGMNQIAADAVVTPAVRWRAFLAAPRGMRYGAGLQFSGGAHSK